MHEKENVYVDITNLDVYRYKLCASLSLFENCCEMFDIEKLNSKRPSCLCIGPPSNGLSYYIFHILVSICMFHTFLHNVLEIKTAC